MLYTLLIICNNLWHTITAIFICRAALNKKNTN